MLTHILARLHSNASIRLNERATFGLWIVGSTIAWSASYALHLYVSAAVSGGAQL